MPPVRDDLDEPSQQDAHQIRGQRIGDRLAAADDHIGQQRQPQRVAMGQLDQLVVAGGLHPTGAQILPALLRAEVAQRHHPQQLPPGWIGPPGRTRRRPTGDHRQGGGRQPRQQPGAHPVIQRPQPLIGVDQDHQPAAVGQPGDGALPPGSSSAPPSACSTAGGDGRRSRPSRRTTLAPAPAASPAKASSNLVLPMPGGPWRWSTTNGGSGDSSAARNSSTSDARPTNRRRRRDANRSPSVPADPISVIAAG
jgi:hypothetical protein